MTILPINHISILRMKSCVSSESYVQYTYIIGSEAQPRGAPELCKYFSFWIIYPLNSIARPKRVPVIIFRPGLHDTRKGKVFVLQPSDNPFKFYHVYQAYYYVIHF